MPSMIAVQGEQASFLSKNFNTIQLYNLLFPSSERSSGIFGDNFHSGSGPPT